MSVKRLVNKHLESATSPDETGMLTPSSTGRLALRPRLQIKLSPFLLQFYPNQSQFLAVTDTQTTHTDGKDRLAVKTVEMNVATSFGQGFFNSCKDVKFGATNGYAMDLLGGESTLEQKQYIARKKRQQAPLTLVPTKPGSAKTWLAFLRYMGQERALGSPFQINYPNPDDSQLVAPAYFANSTVPFAGKALACSDTDLDARCACPDCPDVCAVLPPIHREKPECKVGSISCFAFSLVIIYAVVLVCFTILIAVDESFKRTSRPDAETGWTRLRHRLRLVGWPNSKLNQYDPLPMDDPLEGDFDDSPVLLSSGNMPRDGRARSNTRTLIGATAVNSGHARDESSRRPPSGSSDTANSRSRSGTQTIGGERGLFDFQSDTSSNPFLQPRTYHLNTTLCDFFYKLGLFCAKNSVLTLSLGLIVCGLINIGWKRFEVEKDPVKLWVPKGSPAERAKTEFDQAFGPFYRTEQVIVSASPQSALAREPGESTTAVASLGPVFSWDTVKWWADVEKSIRQLESYKNAYKLSDVCFSPQTDPDPAPDASACIIQSFMGYFGDSLEDVDERTWAAKLDECATMPAGCLPPSGQPLNPKLLFGRVPQQSGADDDQVWASKAEAFIVTYVVKNSLDPVVVARAEEWEATLQDYLHSVVAQARDRRLHVAFSTGLSLEQELNASTNTDVPIVILSYLLMFLYVAINLGSSGAGIVKVVGKTASSISFGIVNLIKRIPGPWKRNRIRLNEHTRSRSDSNPWSLAGSSSGMRAYLKRQILVDSKFLLGLWGIVIVLLSVSTSVALCSALGVKVTLIIAEVIPFLVLAIGVDNVFILSHELDQQNKRAYSIASHHATSLDEDSDGLSSAEERVARALSRMGPSILLSASCETVAFALGALVGMPAVRNFAVYAAGAVLVNAILQVTVFVSLMAIDLRRLESNRIDCFPCLKVSAPSTLDSQPVASEGFVARFIRKYYAPTLLLRPVKYFVMALFGGLFVLSWIGARHIDLGLDQRLALPSNSYLVNYFNALDDYLEVGPPVYFVVKSLNFTSISNVKSACGKFSTCDTLSMANVLEAERKRSDVSYISEPPAVWIDDFFQWLNPVLEDCCRIKRRNPSEFCGPNDSELLCKPCFEDREPGWSITLDGMPEGQEFMNLLHHWLESPTDESCPLGGKAGYSSALAVTDSSVQMSHFRTFHTPLKTQQDYIESYAAAQRIAKEMSGWGGQVFPYSLHYVFFGSYGSLWTTTREVVILALAAVFGITSVLIGSIRTGLIVVITVALTVINVLGIMGVWHVSLNPLSLVNLVISIGIAVEFCSHVARAFMGASAGGVPFHHPAAQKDRDERAWTALVDVGSSVVSGITLTKLIGISVLALTRSKLLKTYYFRMWLALIASGALHGLVFLPVALSFFGGQGYALTAEDGDGSWLNAAVSYENQGFLVDRDDDSQEDQDDDDVAMHRQFE
ncbi:niemann-Pick type C- protein 1 [Microbotryomycetes sp. JL201]|nr:niemann-Pick type C- protein 1 [Microbotryomycetes sp. JL201]